MTIDSSGRDVAVVRYEVGEAVATITLDRPERHNAWTTQMGEQYFDHLERAALDPEVRAIVVTGAGTSFCPGLDMAAWRTSRARARRRAAPAHRRSR